jgi:hypothetical protein
VRCFIKNNTEIIDFSLFFTSSVTLWVTASPQGEALALFGAIILALFEAIILALFEVTK